MVIPEAIAERQRRGPSLSMPSVFGIRMELHRIKLLFEEEFVLRVRWDH